MRSMPVHRSILAIDIESFSPPRTASIRIELRLQLYRLVQEALDYTGADSSCCDPFEDRGDGMLVLIHPTDAVPKTLLLSRFIPELTRLLVDYNLTLPPDEWPRRGLRLRAAVHAGEIHFDDNGYFGEALDLTCRLLDAPGLKKLHASVASPLVLVVSDDIYYGVVKHGYDGLREDTYRFEVRVSMAGRKRQGYVHVPVEALESLTVDSDSATGAIVPPATPFFNELERHLLQTEPPFDVEAGLSRLRGRLTGDTSDPQTPHTRSAS